jgi:hypothetical protein
MATLQTDPGGCAHTDKSVSAKGFGPMISTIGTRQKMFGLPSRRNPRNVRLGRESNGRSKATEPVRRWHESADREAFGSGKISSDG